MHGSKLIPNKRETIKKQLCFQKLRQHYFIVEVITAIKQYKFLKTKIK